MTTPDPLPSSPLLMSPADTGLLVVDVQEKLIRLVPDHERILWNLGRLIDAAKLFKIPVLAAEQYPQGLGGTVEKLAGRLESIVGKTSFSCLGSPQIAAELQRLPNPKWLIAGIEAHVCIQQTALDLLASGFSVYVAVDAVGSRHEIDYRTALARLDAAGATLTTTESALFEWCRVSGTPEFKEISRLVKENPPMPKSGPSHA